MKSKSIIGMLLLSMTLGMFSTSCQDMLSPSSERHSYSVAGDTLYSYWGILKSLQNVAERYVILNECRGDLVNASSGISDTIAAIMKFGEVDDPEKWEDGAFAYLNIRDYYHIINSCNAYIAMCDTKRTTGTNKKYMISEYAQVHAIRAWVYMQLLYAYGENRVPFYTEPMLTTDDINSFVKDFNSGNAPMLNAQTLVRELAPELERLESVELPEYNNYGDVNSGDAHFVCHSSKCMFPVSIVLGDLYVLGANSKDDVESYEKAAQHYYNYIKSEKCGPLAADKYYSTGKINERTQETPIYNYYVSINIENKDRIPYTETGAVDRTGEAITCIPSTKGKLEGKVQTDINRLFGFEAQMRVSGDEGASASVDLTANYEHQLQPSTAYEALCDNQKYEIYSGVVEGNTLKNEKDTKQLIVLPDVGDARRVWIYKNDGKQWTFNVRGKDSFYKMVSKQNPGGAYTTVYPIVYRKSTVWLRYAEALNRAGFPSYAFAILKTGLCNNSEWFPQNPEDIYDLYKDELYPLESLGYPFDYPASDSLLCYYDEKTSTIVPEGWDDEEQIHTLKELKSWLADTYFQQEYAEAYAAYEASLSTDEPLAEPVLRTEDDIDDDNINWRPASAKSFKNTPMVSLTKACACYYLDRRELARKAPFLNFSKEVANLRGLSANQTIQIIDKDKIKSGEVKSSTVTGSSSDATFTIGVHQRGCGLIQYDDPETPQDQANLHRSSYNYVELLKQKIKEATGKEDVTEDDIYGGAYDEYVRDAVEDLIIDEMALELAFEGTRFSDLYRAAQRRGPEYLAERVAKRQTGEIDEHLFSRLRDKDNWFLPVPKE